MLPKIIIVAGTRPNLMKIAPIIRELGNIKDPIQYYLIYTGQHYDYNMSGSFFDVLGIPMPNYSFINISNSNASDRLSDIILEFGTICDFLSPDLVVVVGDVDSTLGCALAANKCGIKISHVESGERSGDKNMPEEMNRIVVDHISKYLFCSTENAKINLQKEGISNHITVSGNVMVDSLLWAKKFFSPLHKLLIYNKLKDPKQRYCVATIHRAANTDNKDVLDNILSGISTVAKDIPVIFPAHPRTLNKIFEFSIEDRITKDVIVCEPMSYIDFLSLVKGASIVITDSGGLQVEAGVLKTPCVTVRPSTEHKNTISAHTNILSGPSKHEIYSKVNYMLNRDAVIVPDCFFGDGKAAIRIVNKIREVLL